MQIQLMFIGLARRMAVAVAVAILASLLGVIAGATPASAACGDFAPNVNYVHGGAPGGYNFGAFQYKTSNCNDVNVRFSSHSTTHRGSYWTGSAWVWSSVGSKYITAGTKSPVVVMISNVQQGTAAKIGTLNYGGNGTWWM